MDLARDPHDTFASLTGRQLSQMYSQDLRKCYMVSHDPSNQDLLLFLGESSVVIQAGPIEEHV